MHNNTISLHEVNYGHGVYHIDIERIFYKLPYSMQYGLYLDFFDSVCVNVSVYKDYEGFHWCIGDRDNHDGDTKKGWGCFCEDRFEAQKQAIEKANELFNNK